MKKLDSSELPASLNRLNTKADPAIKQLYAAGNTSLLFMPKVAVVGSRKASIYTRGLVTQLSSALSKRGICVVSGAALGVDIAAHEAALPNTIAVFGNGLDIIYPKSNLKPIQKILKSALALSEYDPGTPPFPHHFLERNRIVVALSQALIIAEAELNSGTMASANIAIRLGVPIYVLPHRIDESRGSNALLEQGRASLLVDFDRFADTLAPAKALEQSFDFNYQKDELLEFCKNGVGLDDVLAKFGDKVYEYELDGKLEIRNLRVFAL